MRYLLSLLFLFWASTCSAAFKTDGLNVTGESRLHGNVTSEHNITAAQFAGGGAGVTGITPAQVGLGNVANVTGITGSKSIVITNPTLASDSALWKVPKNVTITALNGVISNGTNIVGMLTRCDSSGGSCVPINGTDLTLTTTSSGISSFTNPIINASDYVGWNTTSVSGAVGRAIVSFDYTE